PLSQPVPALPLSLGLIAKSAAAASHIFGLPPPPA
ncbi:unnamed protein product, partial [Urochloa humidicola]